MNRFEILRIIDRRLFSKMNVGNLAYGITLNFIVNVKPATDLLILFTFNIHNKQPVKREHNSA